MRAKSVATSLLLGVAILSLPLCLVPVVMWGGAAVPWMVADFTVENRSGETIYITPVTILSTVLQRYSMGQLRALRQANLRLPAGASIRISYDAESRYPPVAVAIRNDAGEYRQLALNRGVRTLIGGPELVYTVGSFDTLSPIDQDVLRAVQQAAFFNFDLRYWGSMLLGTLAGGIPVSLFWIWARRVRRERGQLLRMGRDL